ncbi:MAG: hypothetical protein ACE5K4_10670 [Candidatus Hydrothermarchaeota archaeon]
MPKYKKLREDIWFMLGSDRTLLLYDPYIYISLLPEKSTKTGHYNRKLCISIGRQINPNKVKNFLTRCDNCKGEIDIETQDNCPNCGTSLKRKKDILKNWARELQIPENRIHDLIQSAKNGMLMNFMLSLAGATIRVIEKIKRIDTPLAQIPIKKKSKWQVYEMLKSNDVNEVFNIWLGCTLAMGRAIKEFGSKDDLDVFRLKMKNILNKFLDKGFYG